MSATSEEQNAPETPSAPKGWSEDVLAILLGGVLLAIGLTAVWMSRPDDFAASVQRIDALRAAAPTDAAERAAAAEEIEALKKKASVNPLKKWVAKPSTWSSNPLAAFESKGQSLFPSIAGAFVVGLVAFSLGAGLRGESPVRFASAFVVVFLLGTLAYVLAGQEVIKHYNLEYALWALLVGLLISNTIGTPEFLKPAACTEFYIKTGLVLLGAEVLFSLLLELGVPGVFVAWVVTPIVLISTYIFGQRVLKIPSRSLNMVISADMSVCGVSAAIATAASCRAKKEELSLAIGLSLSFTVVMMVVMPAVIKALGLGPVLGGAWMGGTIDSTGAVSAAGEFLGDAALQVAVTVKMIQNILIGAVAFGVAVYWVVAVEQTPDAPRPNAMEIWYRFPKFVIGFVVASLIFSFIHMSGTAGELTTDAVIRGWSKNLRGWFFCLAFVSIGLESNFRALVSHLKGGKPLMLYVCGQSLNLALTLFMAWLMFEKIFPEASAALTQ